MTDELVFETAPEALPLGAVEPARLSASTLIAAEKCMLAAYLARQTGNPSGAEAILGNHFHEVAAQVGFNALMLHRETFTADEVEATAIRVLGKGDEPRPLSREHMAVVLDMARRWATVAYFPITAERYEIEMPVLAELEGQLLSGRIDRLSVEGTTAEIVDYKTGRALPSQSEVENERPQLPTYAWHVARQEPHVDTFILREQYVRYGVAREFMLHREQIDAHESWLRAIAKRFRQAWTLRAFDPSPGKHCRYCPNPGACPLPEWVRPDSISSAERASEQLAAIAVEESRLKTRKKAVKAFLARDDGGEVVTAGDGLRAFMNGNRLKIEGI